MAAASLLILDYEDFVPRTESERFNHLIERANQWLQHHPDIRVRTCETIEIRRREDSRDMVDSEKATFKQYGDYPNESIKALRLWVTAKNPDGPPEPHQLGYVNLVPDCTKKEGFSSSPCYESFADVIYRFNQQIKQQPLPGKILCVETQEMRSDNSSLFMDPDRSYWRTPCARLIYYLNFIRIFYTIQQPVQETLCYSDFVPEIVVKGGVLSKPIYQPFSSVVDQVRSWLSQQTGIRLVNLQSINHKLKDVWHDGSLDTQRMSYNEQAEYKIYFIRILRVCYASSATSLDSPAYDVHSMSKLNVRTFSPVQLSTNSCSTPRFERMSGTMRRVKAWLGATRVHVVSAETVPVYLDSGNQHGDPEQAYTSNRGDHTTTSLFVIRLYLNGDFREPPREALPPVPDIIEEEEDSCNIL